MGDNAVTSVPVYQAADVLTAANLNITNSGIPVFSGTATRDAAFGGSGEKVLAEGQFAYLEDSNTVQYYDSAAWQSVGSTPGLVTIVAPTAFSAVTSFSLPVDTFTTTYTHYIVNVSNLPSATGQITMRMRIGGADDTAANYDFYNVGANNSGTFVSICTASATAWRLPDIQTPFRTDFSMQVINPRQATFTAGNLQMVGFSGNVSGFATQLTYRATTAFDSLSLIAQNGTFTGSYAVYAYNVS
jgi:hypothetical protein